MGLSGLDFGMRGCGACIFGMRGCGACILLGAHDERPACVLLLPGQLRGLCREDHKRKTRLVKTAVRSQGGALGLKTVFDLVDDEGEGAVTGDVTGGAEAVENDVDDYHKALRFGSEAKA